jgi:hypothetical protein
VEHPAPGDDRAAEVADDLVDLDANRPSASSATPTGSTRGSIAAHWRVQWPRSAVCPTSRPPSQAFGQSGHARQDGVDVAGVEGGVEPAQAGLGVHPGIIAPAR